MSSLILRPSGLAEVHNKPWSLQIRRFDGIETDYNTLARVTDETAREIIECGAPYWLFGKPDWDERYKARELERARKLIEEAEKLKEKYAL